MGESIRFDMSELPTPTGNITRERYSNEETGIYFTEYSLNPDAGEFSSELNTGKLILGDTNPLTPLVIRQNQRKIMHIYDDDGTGTRSEYEVGIKDDFYDYTGGGDEYDCLIQNTELYDLYPAFSPVIRAIGIRRYVQNGTGEQIYGSLRLHDNLLIDRLGIKNHDNRFMYLVFTPDTVLAERGNKVVAKIPYQVLAEHGMRARFINTEKQAILSVGAADLSIHLALGKKLKPNHVKTLFGPEEEFITDNQLKTQFFSEAQRN
jgi:hypothetical protein